MDPKYAAAQLNVKLFLGSPAFEPERPPRRRRVAAHQVLGEVGLSLLDRVNDPALPVDADSVLVLQNAGPKGVPGFPEWGLIPVPTKLLPVESAT